MAYIHDSDPDFRVTKYCPFCQRFTGQELRGPKQDPYCLQCEKHIPKPSHDEMDVEID